MGERCGCGSSPWVGIAKGCGSASGWSDEEVRAGWFDLEPEVEVELGLLPSPLSAFDCLINLFFLVESFTT